MEERLMEILGEINEDIVFCKEGNLFDAGLLDSFQVIELVSELEDAFDIEIDAKYVVEENFSTKEAILNLIRKLTGE